MFKETEEMIAKTPTAQKRHKTAPNKSSGRFILYVSILAAVVLGIPILFLTRSEKIDDEIQKQSAPVSKNRSTDPVERKRPDVSSKPVKEESEIDPRKLPDPAYNKVINPALPAKKYIPTVEEVENARLGPDGKPRKMSIYKTPAEQAMGVIFSTELGSPVPMLPSIPKCTSREQLDEFLSRSFEYDKDASRAVNENRVLMTQVQAALNDYLKDGGSIGGFIDYYVGELNACHEQWKAAQRMLVDMARSGEDAETLRGFRDGANKLLSEKGIKPLTYPPSVRAAMGEE